MPSGRATSTIARVMSMSAREGGGAPEGWWCTRITGGAGVVRAGVTRARGGRKQNRLERLISVERHASALQESRPQALAMAEIMRRRAGGLCGLRAFIAAGHRTIIRAARLVARPSRIKMTVLYLVLQWQHHYRPPPQSGHPYSRIGGFNSPFSPGRQVRFGSDSRP